MLLAAAQDLHPSGCCNRGCVTLPFTAARVASTSDEACIGVFCDHMLSLSSISQLQELESLQRRRAHGHASTLCAQGQQWNAVRTASTQPGDPRGHALVPPLPAHQHSMCGWIGSELRMLSMGARNTEILVPMGGLDRHRICGQLPQVPASPCWDQGRHETETR